MKNPYSSAFTAVTLALGGFTHEFLARFCHSPIDMVVVFCNPMLNI